MKIFRYEFVFVWVLEISGKLDKTTHFYKSIHFFQQQLHFMQKKRAIQNSGLLLSKSHQQWFMTVTNPANNWPSGRVTFWRVPLRENCPNSELLWSVFSRIWTEYREMWSISSYSVWMRENTNQENSEYGHFSRSAFRTYHPEISSRQTNNIGFNLTVLWKKITFTKNADFVKVMSSEAK